MSCGTCGSNSSCECSPCSQVLTAEGLASQITNLTETLFGTFTKTIVNGRAVWSAVCSPNTDGIPCFPKGATEGFVCYFLRIMSEIGIFNGGVHNSANSYCDNTLVASGSSFYVSIQAVPAGILITNAAYWTLLLTAPAGATGAQGPPGASGGGSATSYAVQTATVTVLLTNTSAVVLCKPAAGAIAINLPAIASVDAGKWYKIWTDGAFTVTVTPNGAETIDNGAASVVMTIPKDAIEIVADGSDWKII